MMHGSATTLHSEPCTNTHDSMQCLLAKICLPFDTVGSSSAVPSPISVSMSMSCLMMADAIRFMIHDGTSKLSRTVKPIQQSLHLTPVSTVHSPLDSKASAFDPTYDLDLEEFTMSSLDTLTEAARDWLEQVRTAFYSKKFHITY